MALRVLCLARDGMLMITAEMGRLREELLIDIDKLSLFRATSRKLYFFVNSYYMYSEW